MNFVSVSNRAIFLIVLVLGKILNDEQKLEINIQRGIVRVNCVDSLDRTNSIQQLIGKSVLEKQLKQLEIINEDENLIDYPEILEEFTRYYEVLGDKLSLQYGGSIAHHSSLGKGKSFNNSLIELMTSVKRHWANNFSDSYKQGAINLFLGMYVPSENQKDLWDLENDIILHK